MINHSGVVQRPVIVDLDVLATKQDVTLAKTHLSRQQVKELAFIIGKKQIRFRSGQHRKR